MGVHPQNQFTISLHYVARVTGSILHVKIIASRANNAYKIVLTLASLAMNFCVNMQLQSMHKPCPQAQLRWDGPGDEASLRMRKYD